MGPVRPIHAVCSPFCCPNTNARTPVILAHVSVVLGRPDPYCMVRCLLASMKAEAALLPLVGIAVALVLHFFLSTDRPALIMSSCKRRISTWQSRRSRSLRPNSRLSLKLFRRPESRSVSQRLMLWPNPEAPCSMPGPVFPAYAT